MPIADGTRADLERVGTLRVFFAHQSVGASILDGLASLAKEAGTNAKIALLDEMPVGPAIVHGFVGENGNPDSKIEAFAQAMDRLASRPPQVALVKFCFVDFTPETDAEALLSRYRTAVASLQRKYPDVTFVHVTAPLTTRPTGVKERLYRLIGRPVWGDETNTRRAIFNAGLRSTFANEPIFDLARIESTRPDGGQEDFTTREGRPTAVLFPGYASDDGHLNEGGRRLAAIEFLRVVVSAAKNREK